MMMDDAFVKRVIIYNKLILNKLNRKVILL